ncbi:MAG TPA: hypothetical protein VF943_04270 [Burkholderiales bacterium]
MKGWVGAFAFLAFAGNVFAVYDADGVPLGASEREVRKRYPSARCKPLEWASMAADRRCDDAKAVFAGMETRITFYLKKDAVEAFDVRFDFKFAERMAGVLKSRYGKPSAEEREFPDRPDAPPRELYKVLWEGKGERALITALSDKRRASLLVSRGRFEEEIYRVR